MKRPLSFGDGVGTGLAASTWLVLLWMVNKSGGYENIYKEFGGAQLPALTRLMFHPLWIYGAPVLVLGLGALVLATRIRHGMIAVAAISLVLAAVTYQGLLGPIFAMSGNIR